MRKKTLEELRAGARERARRWREKNARTHRERVAEVYGKSQAQAKFEEGVTPQEVERYARKAEAAVKAKPREVQETRQVSLDSVEADPEVLAQQRRVAVMRGYMEPEQKGGQQYAGKFRVGDNDAGRGRSLDRAGGELEGGGAGSQGEDDRERDGGLDGQGATERGSAGGDYQGLGEEEGAVAFKGQSREGGREAPAGREEVEESQGSAGTASSRRAKFQEMKRQLPVIAWACGGGQCGPGVEVELEL